MVKMVNNSVTRHFGFVQGGTRYLTPTWANEAKRNFGQEKKLSGRESKEEQQIGAAG